MKMHKHSTITGARLFFLQSEARLQVRLTLDAKAEGGPVTETQATRHGSPALQSPPRVLIGRKTTRRLTETSGQWRNGLLNAGSPWQHCPQKDVVGCGKIHTWTTAICADSAPARTPEAAPSATS